MDWNRIATKSDIATGVGVMFLAAGLFVIALIVGMMVLL